jgi:hypothetical protein
VNEFETEPARGLPHRLRDNEQLLWQGSPDWRAIARRSLHIPVICSYFGLLVLWRILSGWYDGQSAHTIAVATLWLTAFAVVIVAFLIWVARLIANGTVYSISSQRIVMRFGIALPVALNIPFNSVRAVQLRQYADGTGDIPLRLQSGVRLGYLHLWPHVRPWAMQPTQPMLRGVPQAAQAAEILGCALKT